MSELRWIGITLAVTGCLVAGSASAQDGGEREVATRLQKYGSLSRGETKKVLRAIATRMKKSADNFAPASDPLRVAGSRALFKREKPPTKMDGAKLRLRLFAGPSGWALKAFFAPRPGQIASCQRDFSLSSQQCQALVAAAGRVSMDDAQELAGGKARGGRTAAVASAKPAPRAPVAAKTGRFGRYDSGFRSGKAASKPAPRPVAASSTPRPLPQPGANQRRVSTADAYKARREAYLARQRARLEEQKAKREAAAKVAAAEPEPDVPTPAEPKTAETLDPSAPSAGKAPTLDNDFLNDLLSDPLGDK